MKMIKMMCDAISHNIDEAEEHIDTAYKYSSECREIADWYRTMADAHLKFNDAGHAVVAKMIETEKVKNADNPLTPGMLALYNEVHADMIRNAAKVRSMIDSYGK